MRSYISDELRAIVANRAQHICEYCLVSDEDAFVGCEVDHIISVKHSGPSTTDNLAYACFFCNREKGSDIGSIVWVTRQFVRFYNPRIDQWSQHFRLAGARIEPLTEIGTVTATILGLNEPERIEERQELIELGRYPPSRAIRLP
jgi:hypothetical protein